MNFSRLKPNEPFSRTLNAHIESMYDHASYELEIEVVAKDQPYKNLLLMRHDVIQKGHLFVSSTNSESSIFGDSMFNIMFRVVHDLMHVANNLSFSYEDELTLAYVQNRELKGDGWSQLDLDLLYIETAGQVVHHKTYGSFPVNQRWFTIGELTKMGY